MEKENRIIEYWFPIETVGLEGQKEKVVGIGRIQSIHIRTNNRILLKSSGNS